MADRPAALTPKGETAPEPVVVVGRNTISAAGRCEWCGCSFRKSSDVLRHRCAAMQEDVAEAEAEARNRQERWLNDPVYHAHVDVARRWIEMSQGAAPDELLSYAMDLIEDIGHLPPLEHQV